MSAKLSAADIDGLIVARERFGVRLGLERMWALLDELDHPERRYPAIHVVGTNGKSTAARAIESLLQLAGQRTGTYLSPHVVSLDERFRLDGRELDAAQVIEPVLPAVERVDAGPDGGVTQFELLTVAALNEFAARGIDVAVVEAGLGGRYDATNVLAASVVVVTNVALEHEHELGDTREAIAQEKLAVLTEGATLVLGEPEWEDAARARGAGEVVHASGGDAIARAAAEAHLGAAVAVSAAPGVRLPGRLEQVGDDPREIWDGAHNPHAVSWLASQLAPRQHVLVLSVLGDKNVEAMLEGFARLGRVLVATASSNPRALAPPALAERARALGRFEQIEVVTKPLEAHERARALAAATGSDLLVAGSLYLLQDLVAIRTRRVA